MAFQKGRVVEINSEAEENWTIIHPDSERYSQNDIEQCRSWRSNQSSDRSVFLAVFVVALGPLAFGYATGYSSPALEDLEQRGSKPFLNTEEGAWFSVSDNFASRSTFAFVHKRL